MRVLTVDDNAINRMVLMEMLAATGAELWEASGGEEALELIDQFAFDVVMMDLRMPGMDGLEAIDHIRRRTDDKASLPVVMVTADTGRDIRETCLAGGADAVVFKPVASDVLFDAMAEAMLKRLKPAA